ncbi:Arylsulfatase A [Fodinibius sediminis]|uniref:Arylsulfatase A n=2 Tax=Fodinibius sediminis TaxID=1214077 RepID=A0A521DRD3_9BACT|nr:Arylsulfatase A [Fodinibius sediminis]
MLDRTIWIGCMALMGLLFYGCGDSAEDRPPNILWITSEDNSPLLGAYGDEYADTPHLDRLAEQGTIYTNAYATSPVCAPSRFTLITGTYANRMGTENMRSTFPIPKEIRFFPKYLREAGYHTTNNRKKDYNTIDQPDAWDESSGEAHYRDRAENQPFFHVRNITISHESSLHDPIDTLIHDPEKAPVPPYHPKTPTVKRDWAHYYDEVSRMDARVGKILNELEASGEADNTIVFYYGDHGGAMPGSKRFMNQRGLSIPLIVYMPPRYEHLAPDEKQNDRLVSFVDFSATVLSLAGIDPPDFMDGKPFLGEHAVPPREYVHTYRARMDERYDLVRAVHDKEMMYVRNYMPQRIYGQHLWYLWKAPSMRSWEQEYKEGTLNEIQRQFFESKPVEELYDLSEDPYTVHNLASDPEYEDDLKRLRKKNARWVREQGDLGFIPEGIIDSLRGDQTLYEAVREKGVPIETIIETAEMASRGEKKYMDELAERLSHEDPSVRFWAAMGMAIGHEHAGGYIGLLKERSEDPVGTVRVAAAEALYASDRKETAFTIMDDALDHPEDHVKLQVLNLLESIRPDPIPEELMNHLQRLADTYEGRDGSGNYVFRASNWLVEGNK